MTNIVNPLTRRDNQRQGPSENTEDHPLFGETAAEKLLSGESGNSVSTNSRSTSDEGQAGTNRDSQSGAGDSADTGTQAHTRQDTEFSTLPSLQPVLRESVALLETRGTLTRSNQTPKRQDTDFSTLPSLQPVLRESPVLPENRSALGQSNTPTLPQQREQLQSTIDAFRRGEVTANTLTDELVAFNAAVDASGLESTGVLARLKGSGQAAISTPEKWLPESYLQRGKGGWVDRVNVRLASLPPDVLATLAEQHLADVSASSPGLVVPPADDQITLAVTLLLPIEPLQAAEVQDQLIKVQALALTSAPTAEQQAALLTETNKLVALLDKHNLLPPEWSLHNGKASIRYTAQTVPPYLARIYNVPNGDRFQDRQVNTSLSNHTLIDQQKASADLVSGFVGRAAAISVGHDDVFGFYATQADTPMQKLQDKLAAAQPVPADVDLDKMYQANLVMAQMASVEGDLGQIEQRSLDVAYAVLGDSIWGVDNKSVYSLFDWVENGGPPEKNYGHKDERPVVSEADQAFRNAWKNTSKADRLAYLGIDKQAWDKAAPHIYLSAQAHSAREAAKFGADDVVNIAAAAFVTYATAGMASGISGYLTTTVGLGQATAGAVGVTVTAASRTFLTTLLTTGDWTLARDAFTGLLEGEMKDALVDIVASKLGINNDLVALARAKDGEAALDYLVDDLKEELIQQFSPALIEGLQAISPDIVDDFLSDLGTVVKAGASSEEIAEYAMAWWGGQLSAALNISSVEGVQIVTQLLDGAISDGKLDVALMQDLLINETAKHLSAIPDAVTERLGGRDNVGALLAGMGAKFLIDNNFDVDAAKAQLQDYAEKMATEWAQDALSTAITWVPGSETWSSDFDGLLNAGSASGWDGDAMEAYLKESPLVQNLIETYVPGGAARGKLVAALQYAQDNDFDTDKIQKALTTDLFEIVRDAGITEDIAGLVGGQDGVMGAMTNVFGERLIANNGDIEATLKDLEAYAASYAMGFIGEYADSILGSLLGPGESLDVAQELVALITDGHASRDQIAEFIEDKLLNSSLAQNVLNGLLEKFGDKGNLAVILADELQTVYADGKKPADIIEHLIGFLMHPPTL